MCVWFYLAILSFIVFLLSTTDCFRFLNYVVYISFFRTNVGKTRAWMRLALMQKVLAEQMLSLLEERELLLYVGFL